MSGLCFCLSTVWIVGFWLFFLCMSLWILSCVSSFMLWTLVHCWLWFIVIFCAIWSTDHKVVINLSWVDYVWQVIRVIWHKAASPTHTDGSVTFTRLRQCAPPSNTWFPGATRLSIPNCISIGAAVFARLTAESSYTLQRGRHFPIKMPVRVGDLEPHVTHGTLGPHESTSSNSLSIGSPFCRDDGRVYLTIYALQ